MRLEDAILFSWSLTLFTMYTGVAEASKWSVCARRSRAEDRGANCCCGGWERGAPGGLKAPPRGLRWNLSQDKNGGGKPKPCKPRTDRMLAGPSGSKVSSEPSFFLTHIAASADRGPSSQTRQWIPEADGGRRPAATRFFFIFPPDGNWEKSQGAALS